jgi:hypothetical protein
MTLPTLPQSLPQSVIDALQAAGATEEMIAAAVAASGELPTTHPSRGGRPRKHADKASRHRAFRKRRRARDETRDETPADLTLEEVKAIAMAHPRDETRDETLVVRDKTTYREMPRDETRDETLVVRDKTTYREMPRDETRDETSLRGCLATNWPAVSVPSSVTRDETRDETLEETLRRVGSLRALLVSAAGWNVDRAADISPILELLNNQGCDLAADVLPVVAREVPELPRPLKKWGAPWLVRDILAARDQRLNRFADSVKGVAASART